MLVSIFKEKGDLKNFNVYREVKLLEHAMKIVERVFEKIRKSVDGNATQFGFMPGKKMTDALYVVRKTQEKNIAKNNLFYKLCGY